MGNGLRALNYYNDEQPLFLRGYINDKQSRIMGYATMRQLRVTPGNRLFYANMNIFFIIGHFNRWSKTDTFAMQKKNSKSQRNVRNVNFLFLA